jgi:hypothetical protein
VAKWFSGANSSFIVNGKFWVNNHAHVVRPNKNIHDSKTLNVAISHANSNRNKPIKQAVCDRGYVGAKVVITNLSFE